MATAIVTAHDSSIARRKPRMTYKSPASSNTESSSSILPAIQFPGRARTRSSSASPPTPSTMIVTRRTVLKMLPSRPKYLLDPPLPLYHPLGDFAKSLPFLDAERLGLPIPARTRHREISVDDDVPAAGNGKRTSRSRKPAAKLRDGDGEVEIQGHADEGMADGDAEAGGGTGAEAKEKEKPTPKKRRGGGANKRKRKDADDGDSAYPAKRARPPRGGAQAAAADEDGTIIEPDGNAMTIDFDERGGGADRRTTRARAIGSNNNTPTRRDSTTSSDSPSGSAGSKGKGSENDQQDDGPIPDDAA